MDAGELTPELLAAPAWNDAMLAAAGIPVRDVPFVTVGGGIGSFVTVDYLRIAGVPASGAGSVAGSGAGGGTCS